MSDIPSIALVVPVHNYASGIGTTMNRIAHWQSGQERRTQVLFVDDGSTDGTADRIAHTIEAQGRDWILLRSLHNRGKGNAVRWGLQAACERNVDLIFFTDCDLYYGLDVISERLCPALAEADIVLVDRSLQPRDKTLPLLRRLASAVFNRFAAIMTGVTFKDTQAGMKGFNAATCRPLFELLALDGFAFDVELLSLAQYYRFRIRRIPVRFATSTMDFMSSISLLQDSLAMTRDLLRINWHWKTGRYRSPELEQRMAADSYTISDAGASPEATKQAT